MRARATVLVLLLVASAATSGCFGGVASDWAYKMVGLRAAQGSYSGNNITIAIIDTGIDRNHTSLDHTKIVAWKDYVNGRKTPYDDVGHGSHVAGIIVGKGADFGARWQGFDLKGAAPDAKLIVVKAIRADETGSTADVISGINFAVSNGADVICMSLGSKPSELGIVLDQDIRSAVDSAVSRGVVVVASAGNQNPSGPKQNDVSVPANLPNVIAVGAVDEDRNMADFSIHGDNDGTIFGVNARTDPDKKPEVVAPGVGIKSAWKDGRYATASGTSQAAPFVCGGIALLLQKCVQMRVADSSATVRQIKDALRKTAEPLEGQRRPHDDASGYGLFRADQLLNHFGSKC